MVYGFGLEVAGVWLRSSERANLDGQLKFDCPSEENLMHEE